MLGSRLAVSSGVPGVLVKYEQTPENSQHETWSIPAVSGIDQPKAAAWAVVVRLVVIVECFTVFFRTVGVPEAGVGINKNPQQPVTQSFTCLWGNKKSPANRELQRETPKGGED